MDIGWEVAATAHAGHVHVAAIVTAAATALTALAAVVAVIGGYIQYVVRQLVSVEIDADFTVLRRSAQAVVGELSCLITNHGSSTLIVTQIRVRGWYSQVDDEALPDKSTTDRRYPPEMEPNLPHRLRTNQKGKGIDMRLLRSQAQRDSERECRKRRLPEPWPWYLVKRDETADQPKVRRRLHKKAVTAAKEAARDACLAEEEARNAKAAAQDNAQELAERAEAAKDAAIDAAKAAEATEATAYTDPTRLMTRTTVFTGCTNSYRKPLSLPADTDLLGVLISVDYRADLSWFNAYFARKFVVTDKNLDFTRGLYDHQVRRTFSVRGAEELARSHWPKMMQRRIGRQPPP